MTIAVPSTCTLAESQLSAWSTESAPAGLPLADAGFAVGVLFVGAFGLRIVFDSLFIENDDWKPPDLSRLPSIPFPSIPGLTPRQQDPVMRAEVLRLKLQRALKKRDKVGVTLIERELQELIEKEGLAFGSTPEEDEALAAKRAPQNDY
eukprot:CAMPEP_0119321338 /NCGR_PEP_ID=MMETSP1333-20130426/55139_1 /TAXON_ID=418940 /ORGANISM="Scyphosphaera apsteinii, Strain RCC1455" /LENGTH=148 /DNA_ID=CAMNT_0007328293 /DNA_START=114 /DNA_END=560 /DNA_ORIENTATION=+